MQRLSLLFFLLGACFAVASSQFELSLGTYLQRLYPTLLPQSEVVVWVYFRDKGPTANQKLANAITGLKQGIAETPFVSERSLRRRQNILKDSAPLDIQDVPIERSYIEQVKLSVQRVRHEARWFNAISVVATRDQIDQLSRFAFVDKIELVGRFAKRVDDVEFQFASEPPPQSPGISPQLYNYGNSLTQNQQINVVAVHNLGIIGQGVLVGVFDAGFSNLSHPAIATRPIVARYDFVTNSSTLGSHSHGQNTFSVVGGYSEGNLIGPAFGASFVLARTENDPTETPIEEDNWVRAIIWADSIGIDVASTSLGYITYDSPWPGYTWQNMDGQTAVITRAADRASALGIVVVNSAGNEGFNATRNTLGAPADGFNVIAVGAVGSSGTRSSFSSVGPTVDGRTKPDVMAMGSSVWAASSASSYSSVSGTSFSCPLSAGVAALILSANPGLSPFQVREAMRQTASRANNPDREYGWGILDGLKAVNYAWIDHTPPGNTEDTTGRTIFARIRSRVPLVSDSTQIVFGVNGNFTGSALLTPTGTPNEYSAAIPYMGSGMNISYYFRAKNSHVSTRLPLRGPVEYFSYQVGRDMAGPVLGHRVLGNQAVVQWPATISATANDASGIDSIYVEYKIDGQTQVPFALLRDSTGAYADTFHTARGEIQSGDSVAYRIVAVDRSRQSNRSFFPPEGFITFAVVNYSNASLMFEESNGSFTGTNDWLWGATSGTSPRAFSGIRCWATGLTGNYQQGPRLSLLQSPTYNVFSNRPMLSVWHWHEMQSTFDGGNVKISINGGPFQLIQPLGGYPTTTIYNGFGNPLGSQPGFSSVGGTTWGKMVFELTGIAQEGNTLAVRFDFGADNSIQYRGWYIDNFIADGFGTTAPAYVQQGGAIPHSYNLYQNYPNPFNPLTIVNFQLPVDNWVTLKLYDILGREVRTLVDGYRQAGYHDVTLDASNLASGVYFYRMTTSSFSDTKKLMLVR